MSQRGVGIEDGIPVAYCREFLKATGCLTGPLRERRGVVEKLTHGSKVAIVKWNDAEKPFPSLANNLVRVDRMQFEEH